MTTNDQPAPAAKNTNVTTPETDAHRDSRASRGFPNPAWSFCEGLEQRLATTLADNAALNRKIDRMKEYLRQATIGLDERDDLRESTDYLRAQLATAHAKITELTELLGDARNQLIYGRGQTDEEIYPFTRRIEFAIDDARVMSKESQP